MPIAKGPSTKTSELRPTRTAPRRLSLPRAWLLLLSVTIWPVLMVLFHGLLPWAVSKMASRVGWIEQRPAVGNWMGLVCIGLGLIGAMWYWCSHVKRIASRERTELKFTPDYLLTHGPYRYSRNPLYLSVLVVWLGWSVFYGSWPVLAGTFLIWLLLNFMVIPREERGLEARHQESYRRYIKTVRRWL